MIGGPKLSNFKIGEPKLQNGKNRGPKLQLSLNSNIIKEGNIIPPHQLRQGVTKIRG
jgi:hypothetical protein